MQFLEFLSLLQKCGIDAITGISYTPPKTWTILCNYWNFFPFSENVDYHMQFMEFLILLKKRDISYAIYEFSLLSQKNMDNHMQFMEFISFLQKRGLSYAISEISFSSPKNMDCHMQFLKFLSLLQK